MAYMDYLIKFGKHFLFHQYIYQPGGSSVINGVLVIIA